MYKKTKKLVENYFWLQIMAVFNFKNASFSSLILLRALDYNLTTRWCARAQDRYLDKNLLARKKLEKSKEIKVEIYKNYKLENASIFLVPSKTMIHIDMTHHVNDS